MWILIIMVLAGDFKPVYHIEFNTKAACLEARDTLKRSDTLHVPRAQAIIECVKQ
jgi:hypothetical protein